MRHMIVIGFASTCEISFCIILLLIVIVESKPPFYSEQCNHILKNSFMLDFCIFVLECEACQIPTCGMQVNLWPLSCALYARKLDKIKLIS